jgi:hypothetical protein
MERHLTPKSLLFVENQNGIVPKNRKVYEENPLNH